MEINEKIEKGKINAVYGLNFDSVNLEVDSEQNVKDYILKNFHCEENRLISSLRFVMLNDSICEQAINSLASSEIKKLELAINLIQNKEEIVLKYFDSYFMDKELDFFKKLFKKLSSKYHKTIILLNANVNFLLDLVDNILIYDGNKIMSFNKNEFFSEEFSKYLPVPPIISFVKYVNQNKKKIGDYTDIKELIKAIYREV